MVNCTSLDIEERLQHSDELLGEASNIALTSPTDFPGSPPCGKAALL